MKDQTEDDDVLNLIMCDWVWIGLYLMDGSTGSSHIWSDYSDCSPTGLLGVADIIIGWKTVFCIQK